MEQTPIMPFDLDLTAEQHADVLTGGIEFSKVIPMNPAWARMRLAVFDRATHALGSVTIPVAVKP